MEQEQFKQEVLPLRSQLFFYAQRLLDDLEDAEDVIQEVFLKLWYMRNELNDYNSVPALSVQITKRLCLNRIKTRQRRQEGLDTVNPVSDLLTPETLLEQKDNLMQVMRIIDRLPSLQQTILRMRHVDGIEVEEIAELTGSTPEAVRMNLSRARKKVKETFFKMQS
ncbi:MAG: sigma-70 family RNA polymerase sigma factor [Tannerellaceae bacterium]|jgi:RNA polymerase sigma-70 factor (ECF subfamily)|nr:sigma-70 family RNA polymerase sigma factor [Tannerellaceae bacterium]